MAIKAEQPQRRSTLAWVIAELGIPGIVLLAVLFATTVFIAPLVPFILIGFLVMEVIDAFYVWKERRAGEDA
jgi:membrane protein implicated in regulation of membrane protease activity